MFYPDLTSLAEVEALPMGEFNLRVECIRERLGIPAGPEVESQPITRRSLVEILMEEQRKRNEGGSQP